MQEIIRVHHNDHGVVAMKNPPRPSGRRTPDRSGSLPPPGIDRHPPPIDRKGSMQAGSHGAGGRSGHPSSPPRRSRRRLLDEQPGTLEKVSTIDPKGPPSPEGGS